MEDQPFDMDALADELHELVPGFSCLLYTSDAADE